MSCGCITKLSVRRGSTPALDFCVDFDLTIFEVVRVAFLCAGRLIVKEKDEITLTSTDEGTDISVPLTQDDTLSWPYGRKVEVQVRYRKGDAADATAIGELQIERILEEGVI